MAAILDLLSLGFISFLLSFPSVQSCSKWFSFSIQFIVTVCSEFIEDPVSINSTVGSTVNISCAATNCSNGIRVIKDENDITNDSGDPCNPYYCHFICTLELTTNDNGAIIYCRSLGSSYVKSKEAILEVQSKLIVS